MLSLPIHTQALNLEKNDKVNLFIKAMVKKHQFSSEQLTHLFQQVNIQKSVIETMEAPYESQPWYIYRKLFVTDQRALQGQQFWQQHAKVLAAAEKRYGVPASVIVAIIGIESAYGKQVSTYRVIDSLTTLAFYYPRRSAFFQNELEQYLLLTREQKINPLNLYGSYAGAIGIPQFMPSSYRHYAVDYAGTSPIDLVHNMDDAIVSVANYLHKNGWQPGRPIAAEVNINNNKVDSFFNNETKSTIPLATLEKKGVTLMGHYAKPTQVIPMKLAATNNSNQYWLGFTNFSSIMRYNPRITYAMAVFQLSEKINALNKQHQFAQLQKK